MTTPVRLQLSRNRGFNLQIHSITTNGLEAVNVARPTKWGNPHRLHNHQGCRIRTNEEAVLMYIKSMPHWVGTQAVKELRGKNLACWCAIEDPCHADLLLELANRPICENINDAPR